MNKTASCLLAVCFLSLVSVLIDLPAHAASIQSGSPYNQNLGSMDATNYTLLWEGTRLMGTGTLAEWSFFSGAAGRTITPLLFRETAGSYEIVGVGTTRTSAGSGAYETNGFGLVSGSAAVSATDGSRYYFGFSVLGTASPITWNANALTGTGQGMNLRYVTGYRTTTGTVTFAGVATRHYTLRAKVEQTAPILAAFGNTLMRRQDVDVFANGFIVDRTPIGAVGTVSRWVGFAKVDPSNPSVTQAVTPVLFRESGGVFTVCGVGQTRALSDGFFEFDFALQAGSAAVAADANYLFGWRYGNMDGTGGSGGSLTFNNSGTDVTASDTISYFNPGAVAVGLGYVPTFAGTQTRNYSFTVLVTGFNPPIITTAPGHATVYAGFPASFAVAASGVGPLTYQWRQDGAELLGATNTMLAFAATDATNAGQYTVVVSNPYGSITNAPPAQLTVLALPPVATNGVAITEFVADNTSGLTDANGTHSDWIELQNQNSFAVDLAGWRLTDDATNLAQWVFPVTVLQPGEFLIVFASAKDRATLGTELHTNFKLNADGDYLALVRPDGTVAQEFNSGPQHKNAGFGSAFITTTNSLVPAAAEVKFFVPSDNSLSATWTVESFSDAAWSTGRFALGFDTNGTPAVPGEVAGDTPVARANYDGASGSIFVLETDGFTQSGTVEDWVFFSATTRAITPLLLRRETNGTFTITGIGTTRTSTGGGAQTNAFGLVSGSAEVGPGYFSGWKDGGQGSDNQGVPAFDFGNESSIRWFGAHTSFSAGENLSAGQAFGRTYSLQMLTRRPLGALVATDVQAAMRGVNASLYVRVPFALTSVPVLDTLQLLVQSEDGFIAWLNGTEVARRNAPATPTFNSTAVTNRTVSEAAFADVFDLAAFLPLLHTGTNMLALQALNDVASDGQFLIGAQLLGLKTTLETNRFIVPPTPGATNTTGFLGFVADTKFSTNRGFFDAPFSLSITTATASAEIWVCTDGSWPSPANTNAFLYTAPLVISNTTVVRATAFLSGFVPTDADTHTYLFVEDIARQPATPPGFPTSWLGYTADYEVDPTVITNTAPGHEFTNVLRSLPALSIATRRDDLFSSSGIYATSARGDEREVSVELIYPDGTAGFQEEAGLRVASDYSRTLTATPKHSFRLTFKDEYGPPRLHFPLFPDSSANDFDQLSLRACSTDSWPIENPPSVSGDGSVRWRRETATYMRDQWMRDTMRDLGQPTAHGRYVHLYLNGLYWGVYNLAERLNDSWNEENLGGDKTNYDILKDFNEPEAGDLTAWNQMLAPATAGFPGEAEFQRIQGNNADGTRNTNYPVLLNMDNFVDYMLAHIQAGAEDWPLHNWWASRDRRANSEGFRFYVWDQEISNDSLTRTMTLGGERFAEVTTGGPGALYSKLRLNPGFKQKFMDRAWWAMTGSGPLTPDQNSARWLARQNELDLAIVGESARWGDVRREPPYTRKAEWLATMSWQTSYWPSNHLIAIARFQSVGLWPVLAPPTFSQNGGYFTNGFALTLAHTNATGTIWFTLDGTDPRAASGSPSPTAQSYTLPLTPAGPVRVRGRVTDDVNWSPPADALFIPLQALTDLVVTELYYNPPGATNVDGEQFEFLELQNRGTNTLDLGGLNFANGITFTFSNGTTLASGAYFVLARDSTNFAARFPAAPLHGLYTGKLDNGGETLTLHDPLGGTIFTFTYEDAPPWPTNADGYGPSLHRVRFTGSASDAAQWASSTPTPGAPPPADILDTDGDALPDAWEIANGTNPLVPDANADPDHDGLSNWQEYIAGTNPTNAASYLKLGAYSDCGSAVITLEGVSNRTYSFFFTDGLEPAVWTRLTNVPARGTNWTVTIPDPAATTNRFYRVVTPQQP